MPDPVVTDGTPPATGQLPDAPTEIEVAANDPPAEDEPAAAPFNEEEFLRSGWKDEATRVLEAFLTAGTVENKLAHVLDPERLRSSIVRRQNQGDIPSLDIDNFTPVELSDADHKKGLFLMIRDEPGREGGTEPHRCHVFFKRTDDGLKLDWEIFAQTRDHTFPQFIRNPQPGVSKVFRVFIAEDPASDDAASVNHRAYFIADLANFNNATHIRVTKASPAGTILGNANFSDEDGTRRIMKNATVELRWTDQPENSALELSKFICWEFSGLGGEPIVE